MERWGIKKMSGFGYAETRKAVSKDILLSIFYELDHISSEHGRQVH